MVRVQPAEPQPPVGAWPQVRSPVTPIGTSKVRSGSPMSPPRLTRAAKRRRRLVRLAAAHAVASTTSSASTTGSTSRSATSSALARLEAKLDSVLSSCSASSLAPGTWVPSWPGGAPGSSLRAGAPEFIPSGAPFGYEDELNQVACQLNESFPELAGKFDYYNEVADYPSQGQIDECNPEEETLPNFVNNQHIFGHLNECIPEDSKAYLEEKRFSLLGRPVLSGPFGMVSYDFWQGGDLLQYAESEGNQVICRSNEYIPEVVNAMRACFESQGKQVFSYRRGSNMVDQMPLDDIPAAAAWARSRGVVANMPVTETITVSAARRMLGPEFHVHPGTVYAGPDKPVRQLVCIVYLGGDEPESKNAEVLRECSSNGAQGEVKTNDMRVGIEADMRSRCLASLQGSIDVTLRVLRMAPRESTSKLRELLTYVLKARDSLPVNELHDLNECMIKLNSDAMDELSG